MAVTWYVATGACVQRAHIYTMFSVISLLHHWSGRSQEGTACTCTAVFQRRSISAAAGLLPAATSLAYALYSTKMRHP